MKTWKVKDTVLRALGFVPMEPNDLYVSQEMKKVFSWEYVQKRRLKRICKDIFEKNPDSEVRFYFLKVPSDQLKKYFIERIGKSIRRKDRLIDVAAIESYPLPPQD